MPAGGAASDDDFLSAHSDAEVPSGRALSRAVAFGAAAAAYVEGRASQLQRVACRGRRARPYVVVFSTGGGYTDEPWDVAEALLAAAVPAGERRAHIGVGTFGEARALWRAAGRAGTPRLLRWRA